METTLSYEDICVLVAILKKLETEEAVTLFCIIEQLIRGAK